MCAGLERRIVEAGRTDPGAARRGSPTTEEVLMTATSVLTPTTPTRSRTATPRALVMLLVILAFVAVAFVVGRISAPGPKGSPVIAPTASVAPTGTPAVSCRVAHPC